MIRLLWITGLYLLAGSKGPGLKVESTAFANTHYIPYRYTCDGENVNPGLRIGNIPADTKSLALIMTDSSAAFGEFNHWIAWNIPVAAELEENKVHGVTGRNSSGQNAYTGPCPPNGLHEYRFRVYALNTLLSLPDCTGKYGLLQAMREHILSRGEVTGRFQRQ